jgi:hypothetical protein
LDAEGQTLMLSRIALGGSAAWGVIGSVVTVIAGLSAALWWQTGRLDAARDALSVSAASVEICTAANASQRETIRALEAAQARNRAERDAAIQRQQGAIERVAELERQQARDGSVERIRQEPDPSGCLDAPLPDSIRVLLNPRSD